MYMDTHTHSNFSYDADFPIPAMVKAAEDAGLSVLAITEHCDMERLEVDRLYDTMPKAADAVTAFREHTPLTLLRGIEVGEACWNLLAVEKILSAREYDMVIGSVHVLRGGEDFYELDYSALDDDALTDVLHRYCDEALELAEWNGFDTLAHFIYPYRYFDLTSRGGLAFVERFDEKVRRLFRLLAQNGKAFELNTASYSRGGAELALNLRYLSLFKEAGGRYVTVGSDAHRPEHVGRFIKEAYEAIYAAGFSAVTYYKERRPIEVLL